MQWLIGTRVRAPRPDTGGRMRPAVIRGPGDDSNHVAVTFQGDEPRVVYILKDCIELVARSDDVDRHSRSAGAVAAPTADPVIDLTEMEVLDPKSEQDSQGQSNQQLPQLWTGLRAENLWEKTQCHSDEQDSEQRALQQPSWAYYRAGGEAGAGWSGEASFDAGSADRADLKLSSVRGLGVLHDVPGTINNANVDRVRDNEVVHSSVPDSGVMFMDSAKHYSMQNSSGFRDDCRDHFLAREERDIPKLATDDHYCASPDGCFDYDERSMGDDSCRNLRDTADDDWPSQSPSLPESPRLESPEPRESSTEPSFFGPSPSAHLPSAYLDPMSQQPYAAYHYNDQDSGRVQLHRSSLSYPGLRSVSTPISSRPSSVAAAIELAGHAENSILDVRIPRLSRRPDLSRPANRYSPEMTHRTDSSALASNCGIGVDSARAKIGTVGKTHDSEVQFDGSVQAFGVGTSTSARKPGSPGSRKVSKPGNFDGLKGTALSGDLLGTKHRASPISNKLGLSRRRNALRKTRAMKQLEQVERFREPGLSTRKLDGTHTPKPHSSSSELNLDSVGSDADIEIVRLASKKPASDLSVDRRSARDPKREASRRGTLEKLSAKRCRTGKRPKISENSGLDVDKSRLKRRGTAAKSDRMRQRKRVSTDPHSSIAGQKLLPSSSRPEQDFIRGKVIPKGSIITSLNSRTASAVLNDKLDASVVSKADKDIATGNAPEPIFTVDGITPGCSSARPSSSWKRRRKKGACLDSFAGRATSRGKMISSENRPTDSRSLDAVLANAALTAPLFGGPLTELSSDESGEEDNSGRIAKVCRAAKQAVALSSMPTHVVSRPDETASKVSRRKSSRPRRRTDPGHTSRCAPEVGAHATKCMVHAVSRAKEYLPAAMGKYNSQVYSTDKNVAAGQFRQFNCVCKLQVEGGGGALQCSACFHWTHGPCSGLSIEQFNKLQTKGDGGWEYLCHHCASQPRTLKKGVLRCAARFVVGRTLSVSFAEESRLAVLRLLRGTSGSGSLTCPRQADRLTLRNAPLKHSTVRPELSGHDIDLRQKKVDFVLQGECVQASAISLPRMNMNSRYMAGEPWG